tara:strand:- start:7564 stop:8109 length:546 start_codon:yes stop_codon:yes gene_type:complete
MAGQRLTDKTALTEQTGSGDLFMVVDVNDTTGSSAGTSKKIDSKFVIQTDKFSLTNAEVKLLSHGASPKTLVGALSGYMVTVFNVTVLVTFPGGLPTPETSASVLLFGYDTSSAVRYWASKAKFQFGSTDNDSYMFAPQGHQAATDNDSLVNKAFYMYSSAAFNGDWSCDVYVTYAYTKIL